MIKIHKRTIGQGKPIVLVHGWALHGDIWRSFAEALAERYRVTCIDLPGHGLSETVTPFTLERISAALVNAVDEPQSCWLGWSLGATVVLDLAGHFPERVNSLILLAGNPSFTRSYYSPLSNTQTQTDSWPGMDAKLLGTFSDHFAENAQSTLLSFLALQVHGLPDAKSLLKELKTAVFACDLPDSVTLQQGLRILKEADLRPVLAKLTKPVSVILGGRDTLVPAAVGQKMRQLLPHLQLNIVEKAGHAPFLTHPQELVTIISRFMERQ